MKLFLIFISIFSLIRCNKKNEGSSITHTIVTQSEVQHDTDVFKEDSIEKRKIPDDDLNISPYSILYSSQNDTVIARDSHNLYLDNGMYMKYVKREETASYTLIVGNSTKEKKYYSFYSSSVDFDGIGLYEPTWWNNNFLILQKSYTSFFTENIVFDFTGKKIKETRYEDILGFSKDRNLIAYLERGNTGTVVVKNLLANKEIARVNLEFIEGVDYGDGTPLQGMTFVDLSKSYDRLLFVNDSFCIRKKRGKKKKCYSF